jgi:hypothetical protein
MAATATEVEAAQLFVSTALLDRRDCGCVHNVDEHQRSIVVYRNELSGWSSIGWLVRLHTNLLAGSVGRVVNGIGGGSLTLLSLTGADHMVARREVLASELAGELVCEISADQLGPA